MTQLDLQQRLEQAEAERDALQQQVGEYSRILDGLPKDAIDGGWTAKGISDYAAKMEQQVKALAAENLALKEAKPGFMLMQDALFSFYSDDEVPEMQMLMAFNILRNGIKTPSTDAIKRQWMAEIREAAIDEAINAMINSGSQSFGDCIVAVNQLRTARGE